MACTPCIDRGQGMHGEHERREHHEDRDAQSALGRWGPKGEDDRPRAGCDLAGEEEVEPPRESEEEDAVADPSAHELAQARDEGRGEGRAPGDRAGRTRDGRGWAEVSRVGRVRAHVSVLARDLTY